MRGTIKRKWGYARGRSSGRKRMRELPRTRLGELLRKQSRGFSPDKAGEILEFYTSPRSLTQRYIRPNFWKRPQRSRCVWQTFTLISIHLFQQKTS